MNPQNGWGSARDASPGTPLWKRQFPQRSHPLLEGFSANIFLFWSNEIIRKKAGTGDP